MRKGRRLFVLKKCSKMRGSYIMRILQGFLGIMLLIPMIVNGGVNIKNGNFYISYSDISVSGGGHKLQITRTYNSKSKNYSGMFGIGWGSIYETYLTVSVDGSVVIHENGSGAKTRFIPEGKIDPADASRKIVEAMKKKSSLTDVAAKKWMAKFKNNAELREAYGIRYSVSTSIPKNTILRSTTRGPQKVVFTGGTYERRYNNGKVEVFNKSGKLQSIRHKNGYKVSLNYKNKGRGKLGAIKDSVGNQLFFEWHTNGHVKHIWSTKDAKTAYKYNGQDLIESRDVMGNTYKHSYDKQHNMTGISYADETTMVIKYDSKTQFVSSVTDRNKRTTKYKYESNTKESDLHYWTTVTKKAANGKDEVNRYEYEIGVRPDGSRYNRRIATTISGVTTETTYSTNCNLPLKITRGKETTTFSYNTKCLLENKTSSNGESVKLSYHETFNKITRVVTNEGWSSFDYDPKRGVLAKGMNSNGESVRLVHDRKDRIKRLIATNKKTKGKKVLEFDYNALDKPVRIEMKGVGKINIDYDNNGEVKKISSKAGHKVANNINQTFESLLRIVRPAGVNLRI